jgi:hypothetical protein
MITDWDGAVKGDLLAISGVALYKSYTQLDSQCSAGRILFPAAEGSIMSVESLGPRSLFPRSDFLVRLHQPHLRIDGVFDGDGWPYSWPGPGVLKGRRFFIGIPHCRDRRLDKEDPDLFEPADVLELRRLAQLAQQRGVEATDLRYWADESPPKMW